MNKKRIIFNFLFLVSLPLSLLAKPPKTVHFVGEHWPPWLYNVEQIKSDRRGFAIAVIEEIFEKIENHQMSFEFYPWKRSLYMVKTGKKDGIALASHNKHRAEYFIYSDEIIRNPAVILYRKNEKPVWSELKQLNQYSFGVLSGQEYGNLFELSAKNFNYDVTRLTGTVTRGIKMLTTNRFDLFITTKVSAYEQFKNNPKYKKQLEMVDSPFSEGDVYYLAISKKSQHARLIPQINKAILELKQDGTIDRLMKRYLIYNPQLTK